MSKVIFVVAAILLTSCSNHPPEVNLSCTGHLISFSIYKGQTNEKQEPKIVSFVAKAYPPIEKNTNPYNIRIENQSYDSSIVETTDAYMKGETKRRKIGEGEEDEIKFNLNRKTGVLQYREHISLGITGYISHDFEGKCTKLANKI